MQIRNGDVTDRLASHQLGLLTRAQLLHLGWSSSAIDRAVATGCLGRFHPSVYRVAGTPRSHEQLCLAAALRGGSGARLTAASALALAGLEGVASPATPQLLLPGTRRLRTDRIDWRRDTAPSHHHAEHGPIPVTDPARSLVEAASAWGLRRILAIHDRLRWSGLLSDGEVAAAALRLPTRHGGAARIRSLVADGELAQESGGERKLADVLRDLELDGAARWQHWLTPVIRVDCFLKTLHDGPLADGRRDRPLPGVVLEYDGRRHHEHVRDRRADARRQERIEALGIPVLRVRHEDLAVPQQLRARILAASRGVRSSGSG